MGLVVRVAVAADERGTTAQPVESLIAGVFHIEHGAVVYRPRIGDRIAVVAVDEIRDRHLRHADQRSR